jgi:acetylornithine deacetylase/succinyl-diaminopimelate desuccinylase-like protein
MTNAKMSDGRSKDRPLRTQIDGRSKDRPLHSEVDRPLRTTIDRPLRRRSTLQDLVASAVGAFSIVPEDARAVTDMRATDPADVDAVERIMRERIRTTLTPETTATLRFERLFPPLPLRGVSRRAAERAATGALPLPDR